MKFEVLAEYLDKLEQTASRNEMTLILAELFGKCEPEDARLVAYMTQGQLGPPYKSPKFGLADKQLIKAFKAIGLEAIDDEFREVGDLGKAIEKLKNSKSQKLETVGKISIKQVYEMLTEIAETGGSGSQERKGQLIGELVNQLSGVEAKYVVKIVLGKLRTGFSDMTVLDALSWMRVGSKSQRKEIEAIYNVRADLGEVAFLVKSHEDIKSLSIAPELGTPILMARAERAVDANEIWERLGTCPVEYKLDGLRIQAHVRIGESFSGHSAVIDSHKLSEVMLFSRGLEDVTAMFPEVVEALKIQMKSDCIVEGEMIAVGKDGRFLPFQETMQRKRKHGISEMADKIPLSFYLFEVLMVNREDVMNKPNRERREILERLVMPLSHNSHAIGMPGIKLMPRVIADSAAEIDDFFEESIKAGTEGIVAKKMDGVYQAGARDFNWIKYKKSYDKSTINDTVDAVVMGYDVGQGKRAAFGIGDFLIGVYSPADEKYYTVAKIGTGLTDEEWRKVKLSVDSYQLTEKPGSYEVNKVMNVDVWCEPKIVVEIKADEITKSPMHTSGFALRFPRLVSFREKKPTDATSLEEFIGLFDMQGKN